MMCKHSLTWYSGKRLPMQGLIEDLSAGVEGHIELQPAH